MAAQVKQVRALERKLERIILDLFPHLRGRYRGGADQRCPPRGPACGIYPALSEMNESAAGPNKPHASFTSSATGKLVNTSASKQSSAVHREALTGQWIDQPWSGLGRREHPSLVAPVALAERKLFDPTAGQQAGDDRERDGALRDATEGEYVFGEWPAAFQGPVLAVT